MRPITPFRRPLSSAQNFLLSDPLSRYGIIIRGTNRGGRPYRGIYLLRYYLLLYLSFYLRHYFYRLPHFAALMNAANENFGS